MTEQKVYIAHTAGGKSYNIAAEDFFAAAEKLKTALAGEKVYALIEWG